MPEALRDVRAALGPDAIILETFEAGRGLLTVVAASDEEVRTPAEALAEEGRRFASLAQTLATSTRDEKPARMDLGALAAALAAQGVEGAIAAALVRTTAAGFVDGETLGAALARTFAAMPAPAPDAVRVQVVVGPPGDGKTSALVKLAGRARQAGRPVLLIGADTSRVGAARDLAAYARALGAACERAATPDALAAILAAAPRTASILVDTAGATPGQPGELAALGGLLEAAGPSARRLLVVGAGTGARAAHALCDAYMPLAPTAAIVTKCDAGPSAPLLALLWHRGLAVSHLSRGRVRPDELDVATPDRLARSVLAA